jgi:transcriptional regulator with XRE-family HTH domain
MPRFSKRTDDARGPLGRLLYTGRRAEHRNVETCAADCGLSKSFLHFVEQGRRAPALNLILGIADAYKVDRREAAWAWILQAAPDVAIYLVSYETVDGNPTLQRHFSDQYEGQVRAREEARKAANAARRAEQNRRAAEKEGARLAARPTAKQVQEGWGERVGGPSPAGPDFDHVGVRMVDPRETQEEHSAKSPNSVRRGKETCRTPQ